MTKRSVLILAVVFSLAVGAGAAPTSKTITEVLREPLPSEDLRCTVAASQVVVQGPTFRYTVNRASGAITGLDVARQGQAVVTLRESAGLWIDETCLTEGKGTTEVLSQGKDKVILATEGALASGLAYTLQHTFFNDGVAVSEVTLKPAEDLAIRNGIRHQVSSAGRFGQYLHKRRDTNGMDCLKGALPAIGAPVELTTLTSCLEVFSHEAALAIFTDRGGAHRSSETLGTASLAVDTIAGDDASVLLTQHVIRIGSGEPPHTLRAGSEFTFRTGLAVAPNRLPHPRWRDLRMFIWIGDGKHPYPTDEEILAAARLGFTLFQMHRLGTPGEPRPPASEFDRVLKTVHDTGMLFIWTANADLMYANAPGVVARREAGELPQWQGFNYGGKYTAPMDPYCDLVATCLASPKGLADYRVQTQQQMLEKYPIDGMYIDDNLAYANCTLWKEHGHPEPVYDCLIELHEMNWRRRQTLRAKCPHVVLIDHCSRGMVLPVISAFDVHLFGEGYSFGSVERYWDTFGTFQNLPAQGCLWAGDSEATRCAAETACTFDLLTGGGQYSYLDWRLWPAKFPYAAGVHPDEPVYVKTYNLAQYYFGLYESQPHYFNGSPPRFTTSAPKTYATVYENQTWNEALIVLANMGRNTTTTSLVFTQPLLPPLADGHRIALYDINSRTVFAGTGSDMLEHLSRLELAPQEVKLLHVREAPAGAVYHQWGGKRISEEWDSVAKKLMLTIHGPAGLEDLVLLGTGGLGIHEVLVDGAPAEFFVDPSGKLVHGMVTYGREPVILELSCAASGAGRLPVRPITSSGTPN